MRRKNKVTDLTPEQQLNKRMDEVQHMVSEYSKGLANVMTLINSKASEKDLEEVRYEYATDARVDDLQHRIRSLEVKLNAIAPEPNEALKQAAKIYKAHIISGSMYINNLTKRNQKLLLL